MARQSKPSMVGNMSKPAASVQSMDDMIFGIAPAAAPVPVSAPEEAPKLARVVFTNQLSPERYLQVHQYSYWGRAPIAELLDAALEAYFADKPEAHRALPEKEQTKVARKIGR